jgi:regulator of replication initiation timing
LFIGVTGGENSAMDNIGTVIVAAISLAGTIVVGWFTFTAQRHKDDLAAENDQLRIYNDIKRDVLQDVYAELEREQRKSQAIDQRVNILETQLAEEQARRIALEMQIIEERASRVELEDRVRLLEQENTRLRQENDALRAQTGKGGRL